MVLLFRRFVAALVALLTFPLVVAAQESRVYLGGAFNFVTQTHSDAEPLGGTTWGGSALFGVPVSPRVAVEFESSFGGPFSWEYTYRPGPSLTAHVVASGRDTFFSGQARIRFGALEPVVGLALVHGSVSRRATLGNAPYFDDGRSDFGIAVVGGVDAPVRLTSSFSLVPVFRVLVVQRAYSSGDPLSSQTATGRVGVRYGTAVRVAF